MKTRQKEIFRSAAARFLGRQDHVDFHVEGLGQNDQFSVRDATKLRFDFRKRATAQIPAENRTAPPAPRCWPAARTEDS